MRVDKKAEGGELRFVVIESLGHAGVRAVPDALLRETLAACCEPGP
jgi:3-dehydroquinate synthase